jgi:hypothetical protein
VSPKNKYTVNMPTTQSSRAILTTKIPSTTTTFIIGTTLASNTRSSSQTSITPSGSNSPTDPTKIPILGEPTLEGAYKYIGIILISSVTFLVCFAIFAIITCRTIKSKNKNSPAIKLDAPRAERNLSRNSSSRSLDNDHISVNSMIPLSYMQKSRAENDLVRPLPDHEIRCFSEEDNQSNTDFNRDKSYTHDMYFRQEQQSPSRRSSRDPYDASVQESAEIQKQVPPLSPNRSRKANDRRNQIEVTDLLQDGKHTYSIKRPSKAAAGRYAKDSDWETLYTQ